MPEILEQEIATYAARKTELLTQASGKYVLIKGTKVVGTYDCELDAVHAGYSLFGNVPFLVKRVVEVEVPLDFTSNLIRVQMPGFSVQLADLQSEGPVVEAQVASAAPGSTVMPVTTVALVDTGATLSVVGEELVRRLQLSPVGTALVHTPSSTGVLCYKYLVRLVLPSDIAMEVVALGAAMAGQHIQCLIGRDVLSRAVLVYTGHSNTFTLSFQPGTPSDTFSIRAGRAMDSSLQPSPRVV